MEDDSPNMSGPTETSTRMRANAVSFEVRERETERVDRFAEARRGTAALRHHRFRLTLTISGRTPLLLARALGGVAPNWSVAPSLHGERRVRVATPTLGFDDLEVVCNALRAIRRAGARFEDSEGIEVSIDAGRFDDRASRILRSLVEKQTELLAHVLGHSEQHRPCDLTKDGPFPRRSIRIALRPTLHAGEVTAQIVLAISIAERSLTARAASSKRRPFDETSARYDFRCFLLRLGLIGEEFRDTREHLIKRLPGSSAWKHGRPVCEPRDDRPTNANDIEPAR
jgi:hypothetical protein